MFEAEKVAMIKGGLLLDKYGLIALSGGNLSIKVSDNQFLVTPSGMIYEEMTPEDIVLMDLDGNILEGKRKPSVDNIALRYIYKHRKDIHSIVHTHQPYATALGLVTDRITCNLTTLANAVTVSVAVAPYSSAASEDMGVQTVDNLDESLAVVLKYHGVVTVGKTLKQALYAAIYLEEAAKTQIAALSTGKEMAIMNDSEIREAVEIFENYGQEGETSFKK